MSRYELVGLYDCPWFAKAEKIADEITTQNSSVEFHKEMMDPMHFKDFVTKMNIRQGWDIQRSPCIYEVLADKDGKAYLIGDINDFCEYALVYYDIMVDVNSQVLNDSVVANKSLFGQSFTKGKGREGEIFNICIVNAPLQVLELMLTQLLSPFTMIPYGLLLHISIFDEYSVKRDLDGLLMEITDLASPLLYKAQVVSTLPMAFYKCHLFILMEDFSRTLMEDTRDWLDRIEYKCIRIMNSFNSNRNKLQDCRILIGSQGPACFLAEICRKMAPFTSCGQGKIITSGQHVAQRAKSELGKIGRLPPGAITRLHCYGWPGMTGCYVEVKDATVRSGNYSMRGPGVEIPLAEIATKSNYIFREFSKDFLHLQQQRIAHVIKQPNQSMCMAESAISTLHTWLMSDPMVKSMGESDDNSVTLWDDASNNEPTCLHVINAGVECSASCDFPPGTFMVQPAVCFKGKWQPLGKVSHTTSSTITQEVNKLWELRQKAIYRDLDLTHVFPDYVKMAMGSLNVSDEVEDPNKKRSRGESFEFGGEDEELYPEDHYYRIPDSTEITQYLLDDNADY